MKKKYRLLKNVEFHKIMKEGLKISNKEFRIYYQSKQEKFCRIGISVSKKRGNAVIRNYIKRQIKATMHLLIDFTNFNYDLVIIPTLHYENKKFWNNHQKLQTLIKTLERK